MEKYRNNREITRKGGRFAKAASLSEMGFPVAKNAYRCECGHEWNPVLITGHCPECGSDKKVELNK
jgi:Zn finger protein HypA/HybF involved in hydrogenase expression